LSGGAAFAGAIVTDPTGSGTTVSTGTSLGDAYVGNTAGTPTASNQFTITGVDATGTAYTYAGSVIGGANTSTGDATNNHVTLNNNTTNTYIISGAVIGGASFAAAATTNSVTIHGGTVNNWVAGGYGADGATNNGVLMNGGIVIMDLLGGTADAGNVNENWVVFNDGSAHGIKGGNVAVGSTAGNTNNNTVTIYGGTIGAGGVYGGIMQGTQGGGTANGNVVTLIGGTINGGVTGGQTNGLNGNATGNSVNVTGNNIVTVKGAIFGGYYGNAEVDNTTIFNSKNAVRGNTLTVGNSATLTMDGNYLHSISNFETITVHGAINNAGDVDLANHGNPATLNLYGDVRTTELITTNALGGSTVNFNGGKLDSTQMVLNGNYNFNLNKYDSVINGGNTPIITTTTAANVTAAAKFAIDGGNYGEKYALFNNVGTGATATAAVRKVNGLTTDYLSYAAVMSGTALYVTPDVNDAGIRRAAENASSANSSIAGAIAAMERDHSTPADVRAALKATAERRDGSFGRLVTELNNTNSASATTQLARSATYQFNAALGQLFGDTFAAGIASDDIYTPARFFDANHASAGGYPVEKQLTGFIKGYGGFGSQGSDKAVGYEFDGMGLLAGLGYNFSRELQAGALLGYSYNHAELYHGFGWAVDNVLRLGLYGNYNWDKFFFNTAPTLGVHFLDTRRHIGEMGVTAKNERTGVDFSWYNRAGYTFVLPKDFYLTPSASLSLSYLHNPAYTESGANGANLRVDSYNNWSLLQTLDLRAGKKFQVNESFALLPEIWAGWEHEYLDSNDMRVGFAGNNQPWDAPVADIGANRLLLGLGLTTLIKDKYEVFARYDERLWGDGHASQFTVGANAKF
jgi:outer membrane autotransporter protein